MTRRRVLGAIVAGVAFSFAVDVAVILLADHLDNHLFDG